MTNYEYIIGLEPEKLAEVLEMFDLGNVDYSSGICDISNGTCPVDCTICITKWLQLDCDGIPKGLHYLSTNREEEEQD